MFLNIKSLIVVLLISLPTFALCRGLCLQYMTVEAFKRRRNLWLALTTVAFLSPTFWIYGLFALIAIAIVAQHDENPLALFLLLFFVIPPIRAPIPAPLVNQLFDLSQYRVMSLVIALPVALRILRFNAGARKLRMADVVLLLFLLLQIALYLPYESVTNTMRRSFLMGIDTFVIFYVFSRFQSREQIADAMACFWLGLAVMAPLALFETARSWLLYTEMSSLWGDPNELAWLFRGSALRAQVSANHSINLGYHLAIGVGLYLYLRTRRTSRLVDVLVLVVMAGGIVVTQSRGAWVTVGLIIVLFLAMRPNAARKIPQAILGGAAIVGVMYFTPLKESVLDRLPFIGTADQDTVAYRQQLAELSWSLIQIHPFFGDPFVAFRMESLKQGQGIIDIVNAYVMTALFNGLVGVALMVTPYLIAVAQGLKAVFRVRAVDADAALLGSSLGACLIGTLIFIATGADGPTTYILAGMLLSLAALVRRERFASGSEVARPSVVRGYPA